jgi:hypothetical protein
MRPTAPTPSTAIAISNASIATLVVGVSMHRQSGRSELESHRRGKRGQSTSAQRSKSGADRRHVMWRSDWCDQKALVFSLAAAATPTAIASTAIGAAAATTCRYLSFVVKLL